VVSAGNAEKKPYKCAHHLKEPRNNWKLEANVTSRKDYEKAGGLSADGLKIRRRTGKTRGKGCNFEVYIIRKAHSFL
jgi:hypothetical protein